MEGQPPILGGLPGQSVGRRICACCTSPGAQAENWRSVIATGWTKIFSWRYGYCARIQNASGCASELHSARGCQRAQSSLDRSMSLLLADACGSCCFQSLIQSITRVTYTAQTLVTLGTQHTSHCTPITLLTGRAIPASGYGLHGLFRSSSNSISIGSIITAHEPQPVF